MDQNQQLLDLYQSLYSELSENLNSINENLKGVGKLSQRATNPLLLKVDQKYLDAEIKIMFFGQETNGWLKEKNKGVFCSRIEPVLNLYEKFYLSDACFSYGGQFWNGIGKFKTLMKKQFPDKKIGYVYNNVLKIGKCGIGFPKQTNYLTNKYFKVILQEIEILKPDYLIFFSGANYDELLKYVIGDFQLKTIEGFTQRQMSKIISPNIEIPAVRTYHPNYLYRNSIDKYLKAIIKEVAIKELEIAADRH